MREAHWRLSESGPTTSGASTFVPIQAAIAGAASAATAGPAKTSERRAMRCRCGSIVATPSKARERRPVRVRALRRSRRAGTRCPGACRADTARRARRAARRDRERSRRGTEERGASDPAVERGDDRDVAARRRGVETDIALAVGKAARLDPAISPPASAADDGREAGRIVQGEGRAVSCVLRQDHAGSAAIREFGPRNRAGPAVGMQRRQLLAPLHALAEAHVEVDAGGGRLRRARELGDARDAAVVDRRDPPGVPRRR